MTRVLLVRLGEVADVNWGDTSVTKAAYVEDGFPAYSATGCDGFLPYADFDHPGIVLSAIGARCGKTWFATGKWSCIKNTIRYWSTSDQLDDRYLFWATADETFWPKRGAAQPFITIGDARALRISLPSVPEQRRIAAILDKADALRTQRREALAQLDRLAQAIFVEMFGDPVTNSKGLRSGDMLGDFADIASGVTKGRKLPEKSTRVVPYLAVANVQEMRLSLAAVKTIEATEEEIARYALRAGDLLLTEGGDPDKLGRGTLWRDELAECIHQNHIFRVRVTSDELNPLFLNWLVGSQRGKQYFLKSAKQTTGIASINMSQLRRFPLLLPPMALQREFEQTINAIQIERQRLTEAVDRQAALFTSLQHRAFRGEL